MKAVSKLMFSGAAIAALVTAAPAAAQYYPNQGYGYGNQGYGNNNVVGNILNQILGGGNYRQDDRYAIDMCVRATEARLNGYSGAYNYGGYGQYGGYGNNGYNQGYNGARVTRITNVERRSTNLKIYGLATTGYGRRAMAMATRAMATRAIRQPGRLRSLNLRFNCKVNFRGQVTDVDIDRRRNGYGYRN